MEVLFGRCVCGKVTPREDLKMQHSGDGGVTYTSMLCRECLETYKDAVRIVCRKCLRLQGFMTPEKFKDGFEFVRGRHYHIDGCPQCVPGKFRTPVIEHEAWLRDRRTAAKPDLDLIQEIEQKTLQGEQDVRKIRGELQ